MKDKKYWIMGFCVISGIVAASLVHLGSRLCTKLQDGTYLYRNEWGGGNYQIQLRGDSKFGSGMIRYEVRERRYTAKELEDLEQNLFLELNTEILGENKDFEHINYNLVLPREVSGYPFQIDWVSSDAVYLKPNGVVKISDVPKDGKDITLKAILSYEEKQWEEQFCLKLIPKSMSDEEQYLNILNKLVRDNDLLYEEKERILLPEEINGEKIRWKEVTDENGVLFFVLGMIAAVLTPALMERDRRLKEERRKREFQRIYPEFVSKLQLYIGAGLSIKNSFLRICGDYQEEKKGRNLFYDEITISCNQLMNGQEEERVYMEFATRCGDMKYRKLSFLLASSLKQGNDKLLHSLAVQTKDALEERKNTARKQGEEAETKMLLPMMIMFMIVMFLILLPAFGDFGKM